MGTGFCACIAQMALAFCFEAAIALAFFDGMRLGRKSLDAAIVFCAFILAQSLHVMLAGLCGRLNGFCLGTTSALGLAICFLTPVVRRRIFKALRTFALPLVRNVRLAARRNPVLALCWILLVSYVLLHAFLFIYLAPPLTFDALTYHLSKVAQWVHSGSLYLPNLPVKRVFWPSGMELLNCWWAVFPHSELLIELPGLYFHMLATLAIYALARNMALGRRPSAYAALLFAATPAVVGHGSSCLTDLPTAAFFYILLAIWTFPGFDEMDIARRWLVSGMVLSLAVGVKPTIIFMVPGLILASVPFLNRKTLASTSRVFMMPASLWLAFALALFVGSFWYFRNIARFGNPLYPVEIGYVSEDGIQSGMFSIANLCTALRIMFVDGGILDGGWITPNLSRMTGWGWFSVACAIPASIVFATTSRRFAFLLAGQVLSAIIILGIVLADSSCLRFLLWIPGPLAIGFAGAASRAGRLPKPIAVILVVAATAATALNLVTGLANAQRIDWPQQLHAVGRRPGLNGFWQACLARFVPANEDIAVFMYREGPLYLAYGPNFSRGVVTIDAANEAVDFVSLLDRAGIRFLFYPEWRRLFPKAAESLQRQIDDGLIINIKDCLFMRESSDGMSNENSKR